MESEEPTPSAAATPTAASSNRTQVIWVSVALFVLTFVAYWFLGPQETTYGFQVSQANNIIHGHLDMTEEYTKNLGVLERVLYDGEGFCLPSNNNRGYDQIENPRITDDCKTYMQHSLGPALIQIPGVLIWGLDLNQTLVSVVFASMTAVVVYLIARKFSDHLLTQLAMTVLVMFGTVLFWVGSNGGVWFFAHTTAVFFVFCCIYATVVMRNPLAAGVCVGAAFMCRPTELMVGIFPVVALSDLWLQKAKPGEQNWQRIKPGPLIDFAIGLMPFILLTMIINYLRFDSPFETGYNYAEQIHQTHLQHVYSHGLLDLQYIKLHPRVVFDQMPLFQKNGPYVLPSWFGLAMWVTSPPLLYSFFVHAKQNRRLAIGGAVSIGLACAFMMTRAISRDLDWLSWWSDWDVPRSVYLAPFWAMIVLAIGLAVRAKDRLVLACWAAIIPIVLSNWIFAATGWSQFGYRYGLDFMPFLWLLTVLAVGKQVKWHHLALIGAAVIVNLWGVLWIYQFEPDHARGWTWVRF